MAWPLSYYMTFHTKRLASRSVWVQVLAKDVIVMPGPSVFLGDHLQLKVEAGMIA